MKKTQSVIASLLLSFMALTCYATTTPKQTITTDKLVTVYLLIDDISTLQRYVSDLKKIQKPNFNRVIFSFVKPTLTEYVSGSLANTGILGYFYKGDGKGVDAFNQLKAAVALSKEKHIQPFLSVGGWDYSCNFEIFGTNCGAAPTAANGIHYDWFPDPTDPAQVNTANLSYLNLVQLTNDLGMEGIDFDYEEFWHADYYAVSWAPSSLGEWSTSIAEAIIAAGGPTHDNLMTYGTREPGSSYVMPKTIEKVNSILHKIIDNPAAKKLKFATAAPPVGARPTTGFVYGDNAADIYIKGGVWWKGNLKGLWYHLTSKDANLMSRFDSVGLMTYDLCGDNANMCAPYGGGPLDLPGQVSAYMQDYISWLKSGNTRDAILTINDKGNNVRTVTFYPAKYDMPSKLQFGFEVNQPAYPKNVTGQLQLTDDLVRTILAQQKNSDGVIIWQMYSQQNKAVKGATTTKYAISQSCKVFLGGNNDYDCNADFPGTYQ